jgi:hypothetical protein
MFPSVTFVIARYREDLSWTTSLAHVHILNKGPALPAPFLHDETPLPNVGREAHSFLSFIVNRYDDLPERMIFLQGNPFDHYVDISALARDVTQYGYTKNWTDGSAWGASAPHPDFNLRMWQHTPLGHPDLTYKEWCVRIIGEYPGIGEVYGGGHFGVHRSRILARPRELYEKLLAEVSYHNAPQEAHFMERAWIFLMRVHETEHFAPVWQPYP